MSERVCVGGCNRQWREAQVAYARADQEWQSYEPRTRGERPQPPNLTPTMGYPIWCVRDASRVRTQLAELDDLAAHLLASSDGHRQPSGQPKVAGSRGAPSPSPAVDTIDELYGDLHGWETAYRGEDPIARRGFLAPAVTTVVAWLSQHFDGIIAHPDIGEDFGRDVSRWHRELITRTKTGTGLHRKKMVCPRCEFKSLTWREGDEYVCCENNLCGRLLSLDEYEVYERASLAAGLAS